MGGDNIDADPDAPVQMSIDGVLDLHTFAPEDVKSLVGDYLDECRKREILEVRIIHGKGAGVLRRTVHATLRNRSDVFDYRLAPAHRGGWGATVVDLKAPESGGDGDPEASS